MLHKLDKYVNVFSNYQLTLRGIKCHKLKKVHPTICEHRLTKKAIAIVRDLNYFDKYTSVNKLCLLYLNS